MYVVAVLIVLAFVASEPMQGQDDAQLGMQMGTIVGTATDVNGQTVGAANVVLEDLEPNDQLNAVTNDNGYFELHDVKPGIRYHVIVTAEGFGEWTSPVLTMEPNEYKILTGIQLQIARVQTKINVNLTAEEIATEQVKTEEKQRLFGIFPNFHVVYEPDPVPLTAKLKFRLALKESIDPGTFIRIGVHSATQQARDTPDYGQGAQGFAKRFGVNTADSFMGVMIGGAILPSLLHQDPRYFFQGEGTTKSRIRHAALHPFVCRGDNGRWQPNYSSLGGDLASSAISAQMDPQEQPFELEVAVRVRESVV